MENNFFKHSACISVQFHMLLSLRELSQIFSLSFNMKGKSLSLIRSTVTISSLKVLQTSLNSLMCKFLTLHAMKSGKKWHKVRLNNHLLRWRQNVGGCTHSWRLYVVPDGLECIEIPINFLLTQLLFRWRFHWVKIQAQFRI